MFQKARPTRSPRPGTPPWTRWRGVPCSTPRCRITCTTSASPRTSRTPSTVIPAPQTGGAGVTILGTASQAATSSSTSTGRTRALTPPPASTRTGSRTRARPSASTSTTTVASTTSPSIRSSEERFQELNINGSTAAQAFGVNRHGVVVGTDGNGNAFYLWMASYRLSSRWAVPPGRPSESTTKP